MPSRTPTPRCTICEDERDDLEVHQIDSLNGTVCIECIEDDILPFFHNALKWKAHYPVPQGLDIMDFANFLGADFVERFRQREKEYQMKDPVYCKHKILSIDAPLLGSSAPKNISLSPIAQAFSERFGSKTESCGTAVCERASSPSRTSCFRCRGDLCAKCEKPHYIYNVFEEHICHVEKIDADFVENELGQKVGKDIQFCPNPECRQVLGLSDGCNHLKCDRCGTEFCFLCGQEAKAGSMHWSRENNHPRYNQPGDSNAIYDSEVEGDLEDGDLEDDEDSDDDDSEDSDVSGLDNNDEADPGLESNNRSDQGESITSSASETDDSEDGQNPDAILVERFENLDGEVWFDTTMKSSLLLEEIRDQFLEPPAFIPVLLGQLPSVDLAIEFRGWPRSYTVTDAWITEANDLFSADNASNEVRTAVQELHRYFEQDDRAMLAIVVGDVLKRYGVRFARGNAEAAPELNQAETNASEDHMAAPDVDEDPLADIRRLELSLDALSSSDEEEAGYEGDGESGSNGGEESEL